MTAIIFLLALMLLIDIPSFLREKNKRGLMIYLSVFALIASCAVFLVKGMLKSPMIWIDRFLREVLRIGYL